MPFSPDIVVTTEDAPGMLLIVETKLSSQNRSQDESQLKSYMFHMRCPIGLFITPDEIVVFRDTYTALSEQSVRRVGTFPAPKNWAVFKVPPDRTDIPSILNIGLAGRFEENVKSWLEQLRSSPSDYAKEIPEETREALVDYVVPALSQGIVRAGGPREVRVEAD
jgi:hypothetical protein